MLGNGLILFILLLLIVGLGWLAWRAWSNPRALVKWAGALASALAALVLLLVAGLGTVGLIKFYAPRPVTAHAVTVAGTPEQIARGEHLANAFCAGCHSTTNDLPLTGGIDLADDLPLPLGHFESVNLTPAGPLAGFSDEDIFRVIRNGIDPQGQVLFVMASANGRYLSDEDVLAVIAYLRSQPAVENATLTPPDQPSLLGLIMMGAGLIPDGPPATTAAITAPAKGPTAAYGAYIVSYQDCTVCHGADLSGGVEGQLAPLGPSLRHLSSWTAEQFITTMRTGVSVDGHTLADVMPWRNIGRLDDDELTALHAYIVTLK